jgi:glutamyl-tRNA synthetase
MLDRDEIDALFAADLPEPEHWERRFPPRSLPAGAQVTRFCPSPTGAMHLGGIFVALIDKAIAGQTGGVYVIRIEDTDQEREVAGAADEFERGLRWSGLLADEGGSRGDYGPYTQSQRADIYMTYAREFLRQGKAYLCFATREELAALTKEQSAARVMPGYYGRWAIWRDASDDQVRERLAAGDPYVVRFRSPGKIGRRVGYDDLIRGTLTQDDNHNDIVILKSSAVSPRLPTYHFGHLVDDHLMRVTLVIRGEEWIPSVPVHLQLFEAAGFEPIPYAHVAPLMKQEGSTRRKLSKRKDSEASIEYYIAAGYPPDAVLYLLRGLANGRLSNLPIPEALEAPLRLEECGIAGPLVDLAKLEDIAADVVAAMPSPDVMEAVMEWAELYDPQIAALISAQRDLARRALDIERVGVDNPRKDLRKWSDFRQVYGYFFDSLFEPVTDPSDERFGGLDPEAVRRLSGKVLADYRDDKTSDGWFEQIRAAALATGFAPSVGAFKKDPDGYVGSIREASQVVRVLLTGTTRSPGLHMVADVLGEEEVKRRLGAVLRLT